MTKNKLIVQIKKRQDWHKKAVAEAAKLRNRFPFFKYDNTTSVEAFMDFMNRLLEDPELINTFQEICTETGADVIVMDLAILKIHPMCPLVSRMVVSFNGDLIIADDMTPKQIRTFLQQMPPAPKTGVFA